MLSDQDFLFIVEHTPLVSIDLLIRNTQDQLLLGYRTNQPAQNSWFVPGGRIQKDETLEQAFARLTIAELGLGLPIANAQLRNAYTHHYTTNFLNAPGVATHYVVLAYELALEPQLDRLPNAQHSQYRWWSKDEALGSDQVHPNTQAYFRLTPVAEK